MLNKFLTSSALSIIILFTASQICFAQERQKAVLVSKFNYAATGYLWSIVDNFVQALNQDVKSKGYIVIYPERNSVKQNYKYVNKYAGEINNRNYQYKDFDESRIYTVVSKEKDKGEIELWKVPLGTEKPFSINGNWSAPSLNLTKPYLFSSYSLDSTYPRFSGKIYANLLNTNSNLTGYIIAHGNAKRLVFKEANDWMNSLTNDYKVSRNRLKFFFKKIKSDNYYFEFWLIPKKN